MTMTDKAALELALGGDRQASRSLIARLTRIVHARAARQLLRRRTVAGNRDISQEVDDLVQEVFRVLFADKARVLRTWNPEAGLNLDNFVGLVAEREVAAILRSRCRSPWQDEPTMDDELARLAGQEDAVNQFIESRDMLEKLLDGLRMRLSPTGLKIFRFLFVEDVPVEDVCARLDMSPDAVYAWRSRLGKTARQLGEEILSEAQHNDPRPLLELTT